MCADRSEVAKVAESADLVKGSQRFEALAGITDVWRGCELSLKCVASGIRRWGCLREMAGRQHPPPSGEAVATWPAYFSAGRASRQFIPHLAKARILMGRGFDWMTKAASRKAKGLARSGAGMRAPKPAAPRGLFIKILNRNPAPGARARAV